MATVDFIYRRVTDVDPASPLPALAALEDAIIGVKALSAAIDAHIKPAFSSATISLLRLRDVRVTEIQGGTGEVDVSADQFLNQAFSAVVTIDGGQVNGPDFDDKAALLFAAIQSVNADVKATAPGFVEVARDNGDDTPSVSGLTGGEVSA